MMEKNAKWISLPLEEIIEFVIGGDWGKDPTKNLGDEFQKAACIRGSEIRNWINDKGKTASIRLIKNSSLEKRKLKVGDILLEISGGGPDQPVGRTIIIDNEALNHNSELPKVCTNFLRMVRLYDFLNKYFVNHYLQYFYHSGEVIKYQGGSNNLRNLKFKDYSKIEIPLPPLPEQRRIVSKLDNLFGHLEVLKKKLDGIPKLLSDFRQSVLTQAVTGKLTESKMINRKLGELLIDVKYGTSKKSMYGIDGVPVLRIPNLKFGEIDVEDLKYSDLEEKEYQKTKLKEGDILIIRSNGSVSLVGQSSIVRKEIEGYSYAGYLIRLRTSEELSSEYLNFAIKSNFLRTQIVDTARSTSGVNNINSREIQELDIPWCTLKVQKKIVHRLENLFAKTSIIEDRYNLLKEEIELLPQAILAKAFKGDLVEQLDTDGDAKELLEKIKQLKKGL